MIHRTVATVLGVEFECEAEFRVTSYGSGPSWDHPGDPCEIEIEKIYDINTGRDLTDLLYGYRPDPHIRTGREYDPGYQDPIRAALFGDIYPSLISHKMRRTPIKQFFRITGDNAAMQIEEEILETPEYFVPDYGPDDY